MNLYAIVKYKKINLYLLKISFYFVRQSIYHPQQDNVCLRL